MSFRNVIMFDSSIVLANGECPTGWIIFGDYCYHYHDVTYATSGMNWNDSRLACQRYGADLLTIKNQAEFQFISGNLTAAQKRQHYWIGLTDVAKEGEVSSKLIYIYCKMGKFHLRVFVIKF